MNSFPILSNVAAVRWERGTLSSEFSDYGTEYTTTVKHPKPKILLFLGHRNLIKNKTQTAGLNGVRRFRPTTSSPPLRLNLIEFAPNQFELAPNQIEFAPNQIVVASKSVKF